MNPFEIISLIVALLSLGGTAYIGLGRMARIEARVDLIWSFLTRRGLNEAVFSGLLKSQSPLRINVQALERHKEMIEKIRVWYATSNQKLTDGQLSEQLEKNFGETLNSICRVENVPVGSCLAAMIFLLRPESAMFKEYDTTEWHSKS